MDGKDEKEDYDPWPHYRFTGWYYFGIHFATGYVGGVVCTEYGKCKHSGKASVPLCLNSL